MKNYLLLFAVASTLTIWQGCSPKNEEAASGKSGDATQVALVKAEADEAAAAKRAQIIKAKAEKEQQRKLALAEKIKLTPTYKDESGNIVYYKSEVDPSYNGGMDELSKYLRKNLKYPEGVTDEGTVFVDFIIDAKGRVRDVLATDAVGENVDFRFKEEAVRVVSAMPGWNAGRQNGKAVDVAFSVPITFEMAN